jgi:hypothetical protein
VTLVTGEYGIDFWDGHFSDDRISTTLQFITFQKTASFMVTAMQTSKQIQSFPFTTASRPTIRTTQPVDQWVPGAFTKE